MYHQSTKDLFSRHAQMYAQYRPTYPQALITYISQLVKYRGVLWDCGCGNGQLALAFAENFQLVCATDISSEQIANAPAHMGILYKVLPAEKTDFPAGFFDMVVVGQAIHWFNHELFFQEAKRVMAPNAVLVAIGYGLMRISPEIDVVLNHFYTNITGPYWEPERKYLDDGFASLPFPFEPIEVPEFQMPCLWSLEQVTGFLNTWSAVKKYEAVNGINPLSLIETDLVQAWSEKDKRMVVFPLFIKAGKKG
jgi:SAM-dependent methyltransferase